MCMAQVQNCIPDAWLFILDFFRPKNDSEKLPVLKKCSTKTNLSIKKGGGGYTRGDPTHSIEKGTVN